MNAEKCNVMVVEDEYLVAEEIIRSLKQKGYNICGDASNGSEALELLKEVKPDIILMDIKMPVMDGLEATRLIQENYSIPIVGLSSHESPEIVHSASKTGMAAYITKPPKADDIDRAIIIAMARHNDMSELRRLNKELESLAKTDQLTGLYNRRYLMDVIQQEIQRSKRYKTTLSVIMIDIDFFKKVNDKYGHQIGDEVLVDVAKVILENVRACDIPTRFGGEEFLLALPDSDIKAAYNLAERIRLAVSAIKFNDGETDFGITVSMGISTLKNDESSLDPVIKRADGKLYDAKKTGRNKIEL